MKQRGKSKTTEESQRDNDETQIQINEKHRNPESNFLFGNFLFKKRCVRSTFVPNPAATGQILRTTTTNYKKYEKR